jgi:hypothetical protein
VPNLCPFRLHRRAGCECCGHRCRPSQSERVDGEVARARHRVGLPEGGPEQPRSEAADTAQASGRGAAGSAVREAPGSGARGIVAHWGSCCVTSPWAPDIRPSSCL